MSKEFDVVVIGSGPGGYVAAIRGAQLGLSVAIIEREALGGVCLNWGCIPTKALLRSAEVLDLTHRGDEFGIEVKSAKPCIKKMVERSRGVAMQLSKGVEGLMRKNKITVINGTAEIKSPTSIVVGNEEVRAKFIIIATGARPKSIAGVEMDGKSVITYKEAMMQNEIPDSLAIIGAGAIGLEFASFYNTLGTKVTVVEYFDRILRNEDEEISAVAMNAMKSRGIEFVLGASVKGVKKDNKGCGLSYFDGSIEKIIKAQKILVAVGIVANIEQVGLQNVGIVVEGGRIRINEKCETNVSTIFAIGDVASTNPCLAHKASHEGIYAMEIIASKIGKFNKCPKLINYGAIPSCTYTFPQVASVGMTEKQATGEGRKIKIGRFKPTANGKAIAMGEMVGLVKVIFDEQTGELLGAHMCGLEVTEMIQGFAIAKSAEATEDTLAHTIFPHPTISEMMHEATLDALGMVIHM